MLPRLGVGRRDSLNVKPPILRDKRERPGELIHIGGKRLGKIDGAGRRITGGRRGQSTKRGPGWEALHGGIDDASRLADSEIPPGETKESAACFRNNAVAFFARRGVTVERIMSDNGSAYKSRVFRDLLKGGGLRRARARPDTPKTHGAAGRFIQTSLRERIDAAPRRPSAERANARPWVDAYHARSHSALNRRTPWPRLNNLLANDS